MKIALKFFLGFGIFIGIISLILLITGNPEAFFGTIVISLGFIGLSWAGHRILIPAIKGDAPTGISLVIGIVFGGAGFLMLIGAVLLYLDGEFEGAIGMAIFGLVFCGAAYGGARIFAPPKGKKRILIGKGSQTVKGILGYSAQFTGHRYIYVDQNTPESEIEQMQKNWLEKPWTQRADWAEGKIVQQGPGSMRLLFGFTILWNVIAWGIAAFGIISDWGMDEVPWFLLVFPLIGIGIAIMTVRTWIRRRKFGISVLELQTVPASPGDWLRGTVQTGVPVKNQTAKEFRLRLVCAKRSTYRDQDGDRRISEENIWHEDQTVFGGISGTSPTFTVSVNMAIPPDLPSTKLYPEDDRTLWRLEITAALRGVNYAAQFEVPVFNQDKS